MTESDPKTGIMEAARSIDLRCLSETPDGITFENLRRRGIDLIKIRWENGPAKRGFLASLFGSGRPRETVLTIADERLLVTENGQEDVAYRFEDVTDVVFDGGETAGSAPVTVVTESGTVAFGTTLSQSAKTWLRDRLVLELSGLVWRPVFNVGKRTTQKTSNPDHQYFRLWQSKSGRLIEQFLDQAPPHIAHIEALTADGAVDDALSAAHWLKASCAAIGASHLSELCQRIEIDLRAGSETRAKHLCPHIVQEFNSVVAALSETPGKQVDNVTPTAQPEPQTENIDDTPLKGMRILVAEDSLVNQEVVRDCLEQIGSEMIAAADGEAAVQKVMEADFPVILMDCQMPKLDGFKATRRIRDYQSIHERPRSYIVALTANALQDDMIKCFDAGMDDYVSKPFDYADLVDALIRSLETGKTADVEADPGDETGSEAEAENETAEADGLAAEQPTENVTTEHVVATDFDYDTAYEELFDDDAEPVPPTDTVNQPPQDDIRDEEEAPSPERVSA